MVKLAVFDVDRALLVAVAPTLIWLLDYRFFLLPAAVAVLLLLIGPMELLWLWLFVATYPLILLFWKIPKRFWRHWPLVLLLPPLNSVLPRLVRVFLLYSLACAGTLCILRGSEPWLMATGLAFLLPLLIARLWRSIREPHAASLLTQLVALLSEMRVAVESGKVPWTIAPQPTTPPATPPPNPRQLAYASHCLSAIVADYMGTVAKRRYYDFYLLASWFYTVVLTAVLFAFVHLGLSRILPHSYAGADVGGFWSFLEFSLGVLTTSNVSKITPVAVAASIATSAEVLSSVVILVVLVFSILTAAREAFRERLEEVAVAVGRIGTALETSIRAQFRLSIAELEVALLNEAPAYVNQLRKARGLPELVAPQGGGTQRSAGG